MKRFLAEWQKKVQLSHGNGERGAKSNPNESLAVARKAADELLLSSVSREMSKPRTAKSAQKKAQYAVTNRWARLRKVADSTANRVDRR